MSIQGLRAEPSRFCYKQLPYPCLSSLKYNPGLNLIFLYPKSKALVRALNPGILIYLLYSLYASLYVTLKVPRLNPKLLSPKLLNPKLLNL